MCLNLSASASSPCNVGGRVEVRRRTNFHNHVIIFIAAAIAQNLERVRRAMRCGKSRAAQLAITVEIGRGNCGLSETLVGHIMLGVASSV